MVGSAIVRKLREAGYENLLLKTRSELDLTDQRATQEFFRSSRPAYVIMAAGKVAGIHANDTYQADFLYENLIMSANVIRAAADHGTRKLLYLGSSCVFPRLAPQPLREDSLLSGPLEKTNEGYAVAKIAGLKLCETFARQYGKSFIAAMPSNLYGPGDNFHPMNSHVVAGMLRRFHEAKEQDKPQVDLWGTGAPLRELLYVDDLAEAILVLMDRYDDPQFINVGSGEEVAIRDLATLVAGVVGYSGRISFDPALPDGTPRKILESSRIRELGWRPSVDLATGVRLTYEWALNQGVFSAPVGAWR